MVLAIYLYLSKKADDKLLAVPLHASQNPAEQKATSRSEADSSVRKCVVATNVAETSLTIEGIVYIIDTGIEKRPGYNPKIDMDSLTTSHITKTSTMQRAGRAGRTQPGVCFRLDTEETFHRDFAPDVEPSIFSTSFVDQALTIISMGFDILDFDLIDPLDTEVFLRAISDLHHMGYISLQVAITETGRMVTKQPINPMWWNAIVEGARLGCTSNIIMLAAVDSVQGSLFSHPFHYRTAAHAARQRFSCPASDHISSLHALQAYCRTKALRPSVNMDQWCLNTFFARKIIEEVLRVRSQVVTFYNTMSQSNARAATFDAEYETKVAKALARGLYHNIAIHKDGHVYKTVHDNYDVLIDAYSDVTSMQHSWVVFNKIQQHGKAQLHTVTQVKPGWIVDLPVFQEDNIRQRRTGGLVQPQVKAALDDARGRVKSQS